MPVILMAYDASQNVAHWVYVQSLFRKLADLNVFAGKTVTVPIPAANNTDVDAMVKFARFRDRMLRQMRGVVHDEDEDQDDSV